MMNMQHSIQRGLWVLVAGVLASTAGCGGGGAGAGSSGPTTASGTFIDSAVSGLHYVSGGQSGTTGGGGSFTCEVGQDVTFSIGNLTLGTATCTADAAANVVRPTTLCGSADLTDVCVVNVSQLLQTLDSSGDLSDGIQIDPAAYTALTDISGVDLTDDTGDSFDAAVGAFLTEVKGAPTPLVSEASATAHLQSQTLVGSWYFANQPSSPGNAGGTVVFTFFTNGSYFLAEDGDSVADPNGQDGIEHGTYTWNATTGNFSSPCPAVNTNGEWGLSHQTGGTCSGTTAIVTISGDTLSIDGIDGSTVLTRVVPDAGSPVVGSWRLDDGGDQVVVTFFADNSYVLAEDGDPVADPNVQDGMERGTYTWDQGTHAFSATVTTDTDGEGGLSDPQGTTTVQISGNTLTFTDSVEGSFIFTRVVP